MPQSLLRVRDGRGASVSFSELLFALMLLGLFAAAALTHAFGNVNCLYPVLCSNTGWPYIDYPVSA
ncbi:hypothetical protein FHU10_0779 [Serratia fonticola]|uniref:Uncharacterized protein n=1 Tax=Serratia fonticola TaxID=47917 RepID=A0A542D6V3_SERFO|nr:hypothetical protein FHU09_1669 [Serratia fonticola]TQI98823.1 hypothetical protein FHU11_4379 [Serratia fonticola]TVZ68349.1 hypothetical protein FHU10_0779 [Serratia fonticola]